MRDFWYTVTIIMTIDLRIFLTQITFFTLFKKVLILSQFLSQFQRTTIIQIPVIADPISLF